MDNAASDERAAALITELAEQGLRASKGDACFASILLVDAASSILASSTDPASAGQIAKTLGAYIVEQVEAIAGPGEVRQ